jgi:hypothetical protein
MTDPECLAYAAEYFPDWHAKLVAGGLGPTRKRDLMDRLRDHCDLLEQIEYATPLCEAERRYRTEVKP